jgi:hypothetical protein
VLRCRIAVKPSVAAGTRHLDLRRINLPFRRSTNHEATDEDGHDAEQEEHAIEAEPSAPIITPSITVLARRIAPLRGSAARSSTRFDPSSAPGLDIHE